MFPLSHKIRKRTKGRAQFNLFEDVADDQRARKKVCAVNQEHFVGNCKAVADCRRPVAILWKPALKLKDVHEQGWC